MFHSASQGPVSAVQKPAPAPMASVPSSTTSTATSDQAPASEEARSFLGNRQPMIFDGKRMRKAVIRKTIDYNSCVVKYLENRKWFKNLNCKHGIQPDEAYAAEILPPRCMIDNPVNAVTTKFVRTSTNKLRCPIFCVVWTPEGRRLVTGASSGEFTLWNGLTFNFETILTAHDSPVRSMVWNHHDSWLLSADHGGIVKYWQSNMNNVQMYEAHKEPIRGLSFSPTDNKYASCADDGLVKIWDFYRCTEEKVLRGHGADVKSIDWHPDKSLLVSGSKDSQQPIKLWDTRTGNGLATLHLHKSTVMSIKWNQNGNWLLTASRDHQIKLFDIRAMKEIQAFRGHKREATAIAWHPVHENLFASGGSDGAIMFWMAGVDKDVGNMESAHEGMVWTLAWHPLGHILCSGSNDHTSKFWTRNRLGDRMRDRYNLNIQDTEDDMGDDIAGGVRGFSVHHATAIPGMDTTLSASDPDFLDMHSGLPDFGSPTKNNQVKPSQNRSSVNDKFTLPGFGSQPPKPGAFAAANAGNQPPQFGRNGPRFGSDGAFRPGAPPFQPRAGGEPLFQPPRPQMNMPGGKPWENKNSGPDNRMQPHGGPQFGNNTGQDFQRPFQRGGPGHPDGFRPQERDPRLGEGPNLRGPADDQQRHRPGMNEQWPPHEQGRGPGPDNWRPSDSSQGPDGGPPTGHGRGAPNDPRRPPTDARHGPGAREGPPDFHQPERGPRGGRPLEGRPGILGSPPRGLDGQPLGPPLTGNPNNQEPRRPSGERNVHMEPPRFDLPNRGLNDVSSGVFRQGSGQGRGNELENNSHPFQENLSSRGFKHGVRGRGGSTDHHDRPWPPSGEDPFGKPPNDRAGPDRPPWNQPQEQERGQPHNVNDFRGPPPLMDHDPRGARDPRGPPPRDPRAGPQDPRDQRGQHGPLERRHSNEPPRAPNGNGPKPLMSLLSLAPIAPPPGAEKDVNDLALHDAKLGAQRKRPGEERSPRNPRQRDSNNRDMRQNDPRQRDPLDRDMRQSDLRQIDPRQSDSRQSDMRQSDSRQSDMRQIDPRQSDMRQSDMRQRDPLDLDMHQRDPRGSRGSQLREDAERGPPPPKMLMREDEAWHIGPPQGPPHLGPRDERREGRGESSFADDQWDDVSWNKNENDQFAGGWRRQR